MRDSELPARPNSQSFIEDLFSRYYSVFGALEVDYVYAPGLAYINSHFEFDI